MTEQAIKKILNRKIDTEKNQDKILYKYSDHGVIRQMILSSRGDSLSNQQLTRHYYDLRIRKLISNLFYLLPIAAYGFYRKTNLLLLFIPCHLVSNYLYKHVNMSTFGSDYSYNFAKRSMDEYYGNILVPNFKKLATMEDKWNISKNQIPHKEWIERNDYK